jgi:hypothetical protein
LESRRLRERASEQSYAPSEFDEVVTNRSRSNYWSRTHERMNAQVRIVRASALPYTTVRAMHVSALLWISIARSGWSSRTNGWSTAAAVVGECVPRPAISADN